MKTMSITNTIFEYRVVYKVPWYLMDPATLGRRSMINFVIMSSDLRPHVFDTQLERGRAVN